MGLVMGPSNNGGQDSLSLPGLGNLSSALSGLVTGGQNDGMGAQKDNNSLINKYKFD